MKKYKVGYLAYNLDSDLNQAEVVSMIENEVAPDFFIFHQNKIKYNVKQWLNPIIGKRNLHPDVKRILGQTHCYWVKDINSQKALSIINNYSPAIIVCNSGLIKSSTLNQLSENIFLNKHASYLPKYRGVDNIEWALLENQPIFGTVLRINDGIDEGDILYQEPISFDKHLPINEIRKICFIRTFELTGIALGLFLSGKIGWIPQKDKGVPLMQYYSMHPILSELTNQRIALFKW